jgi:hypothetical protein
VIFATLLRHRQAVVRLCCCALLLLGAGAQLHGLSHALEAAQQAKSHHDTAAAHSQVCEQCLQYAALDAAMPTIDATGLWTTATQSAYLAPPSTQRAATFAAYRSRAPPRIG